MRQTFENLKYLVTDLENIGMMLVGCILFLAPLVAVMAEGFRSAGWIK